MANISISPSGEHLQDGQTAEEWLESLFEFEYCAECGHDTEDHVVTFDMFGLFHATCTKEPRDA